jgi:UDP-glucose 4-epimerase/UDP-glucuronate decarboxylase
VNILLLGGAGFIGLHLARRLVADNHMVTIIDDFSRGSRDHDLTMLRRHPSVAVRSADLTSAEEWASLGHGWDQIYLLAAVVGVRNVERDPARVVRVNSLTALHLLDWVRDNDGTVFFASTSEVYAGGVDAGIVPVPTAEDVPVMVADVAAPRFAYAISKLLGEAAFLHAARAKGVSAVIGRFHNVYGPRMGADHVIPEMLLRAMGGENPFVVRGSDQYRAFCYIDDAVEAMMRLTSTPEAVGQIVNIGDDTQVTKIADLASLVLGVCGESPRIETRPAPPGSVARRCPDLAKLRDLTGYEPKVPLAEGLRRTMEWYRASVEPGWDGTGPRRRPIAFYYGGGQLERLAGYRKVVLQPEFYSQDDLAYLRDRSVQPLAYLSLSEDQGPPAPWQRADRNPDWGGSIVQVGHPGWVAQVTGQAEAALAAGFTGLFLDTLNLELTHPDDVPHLLTLIGTLRRKVGSAYMLANRGFGMLPDLAGLVDGVLFESFSVRWTDDGYAPWPPDVLECHAEVAERLLDLDVELYALDYADSEGLKAFAVRRARQFGLHSFVSDRALSRL